MNWPAVSDNPFLSDLTTEEHDFLTNLFVPFSVPARSVIVRQGDRAEYLYLISHGRVVIRYKPYDGPRITLTHLGTGDIFGWSAVVGSKVYTSDAISTTPLEAWRLRGDDLRELCRQHPAAGNGILEKLAKAVSPRWVHARNQIQVLFQEHARTGA